MVARFLTFSALVAAATAVALPVVPVAKLAYAQPEAPSNYEFSYSVHDDLSGDVKQQQEAGSGDAVQGSYSLVQPDGVHRIVDYTADDVHGFNAIVRYEGTPIQQAPAKIAVAAPVTYAHAPVAKIAYAAPVAKVAYAPAPVSYAQAPTQISYSQAPAQISYSHAPAQVSYQHAPAQVSYQHAPAQVSYQHAPAAQVSYQQAPAQISYQHAPAQVSYAPASVSYAQAPVAYASAPVAKVAYATAPVTKVAYGQNLGHVTFSSPAVSYHH